MRRASGGREPERRAPMLLRTIHSCRMVVFLAGPPAWTWVGGSDNQHPRGEIGILKDVTKPNIESASRCFIYIEHEAHLTSAAFRVITRDQTIKVYTRQENTIHCLY
jgi:hypothetical protein